MYKAILVVLLLTQGVGSLASSPNSNVTSQTAVIKSKGFGFKGAGGCRVKWKCFNDFEGTIVYKSLLLGGGSKTYYAVVEETSVTLGFQKNNTTTSLESILDSVLSSPFEYETCVMDGAAIGLIHKGRNGTLYCISYDNPFYCDTVLRADDGQALRFARVIKGLVEETWKNGNHKECLAIPNQPVVHQPRPSPRGVD